MVTSHERHRATTYLTIVIAGAWVLGFCVRIFIPDFTGGPGMDAMMLIILGYWFAGNAVAKRINNGKPEHDP